MEYNTQFFWFRCLHGVISLDKQRKNFTFTNKPKKKTQQSFNHRTVTKSCEFLPQIVHFLRGAQRFRVIYSYIAIGGGGMCVWSVCSSFGAANTWWLPFIASAIAYTHIRSTSVSGSSPAWPWWMWIFPQKRKRIMNIAVPVRSSPVDRASSSDQNITANLCFVISPTTAYFFRSFAFFVFYRCFSCLVFVIASKTNQKAKTFFFSCAYFTFFWKANVIAIISHCRTHQTVHFAWSSSICSILHFIIWRLMGNYMEVHGIFSFFSDAVTLFIVCAMRQEIGLRLASGDGRQKKTRYCGEQIIQLQSLSSLFWNCLPKKRAHNWW